MLARLLAALALAALLAGCEPVMRAPVWYFPNRLHTMECLPGECDIGESGSRGKL